MTEESHNLDAMVFVFRHKETQKIVATYVNYARSLEKDADYEHLATLEPRLFIQYWYDKCKEET